MATIVFERLSSGTIKATVGGNTRYFAGGTWDIDPTADDAAFYIRHSSGFNVAVKDADTVNAVEVADNADEIAEDLATDIFFLASSGGGGGAGELFIDDTYLDGDGTEADALTVKADVVRQLPTEYTTTQPSAPSTGVTPYAFKRTNQTFQAVKPIRGNGYPLHPHQSFKRVASFEPLAGGTTLDAVGLSAGIATGTATARTLDTTNFLSSLRRLGIVSAGSAGSVANYRIGATSHKMLVRGNAAGIGGFYTSQKFGVPQTAAGCIIFVGLVDSVNAPGATTEASARATACIGVGKDSGDTNFQIIHNDGTTGGTKVDTGVAPSNTEAYSVRIFCLPNDSVVYVSFTTLSTGATVEATLSTELPPNTTYLGWTWGISNNATAAAVAIDLIHYHQENDN